MTCGTGKPYYRLIVVAVLVLCTAFVFLFPQWEVTAFAASLPESYTEAVGADGDWYFSDDYLSVEKAAEAVARLRDEYDFSALQDDPVVIAVIDTGINPDNDLFGSVEEGTDIFLRDAEGEVVAYNAMTDTTGLSEVSDGATRDYHGTHTSGIVALLIRALGLEDCVKILPIKAGAYSVTGNSFSLNNVRRAVSHALDCGADIVNLSLGIKESTNGSSSWKTLVSDLDAEKAVFVAAAGNYADSSDDDPFYPAASENVIGVMSYAAGEDGAELYRKGIASGSNYGSMYDVCAPGVDIVSADGATGGYKTLTGTSMASPVTAFAVALLEVRCRAEGESFSPAQIKDMFLLTSTDTLYADGEEYPLLSLTGLLSAEFAFDGQGNAYIASAVSDAIAFSSPYVTLGRGRAVQFYADSDYVRTGAKYVWTYTINGVNMTADGQRLILSFDIYEKADIPVTMTVYAPDGEQIAKRTSTLAVRYLVPTAENSSLTLSLRAEEDGTVILAQDKTLVLSVDTLRYADPTTEVVWYVNGEEASKEHSFSFAAEFGGTYLITVKVNGEQIGDGVTVYAEGESAPDGLPWWAVTGISVGAACFVAAVVLSAVAAVKKRRLRNEGEK